MTEETGKPTTNRLSIRNWFTQRDREPKSIEEKLRDDIGRMVEHCRNKGIAIPDETISLIGTLQPSPGANGLAPTVQVLLKLQGQLSELIKPATSQSLEATQIRWSSKTALTWVLLVVLTVVSIGGIIGYVALVPYVEANVEVADAVRNNALDPLPNSTLLMARSPLVWVCLAFAALMGAGLHGLLTATPYLRERTFDRSFFPVYLIRLVIGTIAGMILAKIVVGELPDAGPVVVFTPGVIALLGGYSAEAVRQILDRLVLILTTAVQGEGTDS
jgi:hypothetical protein